MRKGESILWSVAECRFGVIWGLGDLVAISGKGKIG